MQIFIILDKIYFAKYPLHGRPFRIYYRQAREVARALHASEILRVTIRCRVRFVAPKISVVGAAAFVAIVNNGRIWSTSSRQLIGDILSTPTTKRRQQLVKIPTPNYYTWMASSRIRRNVSISILERS